MRALPQHVPADLDACERHGTVGVGRVDDLELEPVGRQVSEGALEVERLERAVGILACARPHLRSDALPVSAGLRNAGRIKVAIGPCLSGRPSLHCYRGRWPARERLCKLAPCLGDMEIGMELRHLRYFVAVADAGSLTVAA